MAHGDGTTQVAALDYRVPEGLKNEAGDLLIMCGLAGIIDGTEEPRASQAHLAAMLARIVHRGPDDAGVWQSGEIVLGHRRLSIVDISPLGHQPMVSRSRRYVLVFNGEIYNHNILRQELSSRGWTFKGHSDTEVLLALIEETGLEEAIRRSVGMFALAVWDTQNQILQLARDRFGEKPIYYGWHDGRFLFGSELKVLLAHPTFHKNINRDALALLVKFGYIPAPYTIFHETWKLPPGNILTLCLPDDRTALSPQSCRQSIRQYWSAEDVAIVGLKSPFRGSFEEATDDLETLLAETVRLQMQADVPLGAFLSGGIDSSAIVALLQRQSSRPVKTYSIGFESTGFNEAEHARAVAAHLGTEHTEFYVSGRDALEVIPQLPEIYDEPFGDSSQIPTYLVAKLARRDVTVCVSGDGGDEIFCGYAKYGFGSSFARVPLRRLLSMLVGALPWRAIEHIGKFISPSLGRKVRASRLETLYSLLKAKNNAELAETVSMFYRRPEELIPGCHKLPTAFDTVGHRGLTKGYQPLAMVFDRQNYLPDDVLVKVDRATMAVSMESRAPLLDHRIVEFVARLPIDFLCDGRSSKRILRALLYRYVPQSLVDRPKAGFNVPLASWMRSELREWAWDLLTPYSSSNDDYLAIDSCRALLDAHLRGKQDSAHVLWPILMFQAWRQRLA